MPTWTTKEVRLLKTFHRSGTSWAEIQASLPRHTVHAVKLAARKYDVRPHHERESSKAKWARITREYFARREAGLLR